MYICVFSRSEGAGSATTRNTRGLTRSVSARIVPPLPAVSRPSNTMMMRRPFLLDPLLQLAQLRLQLAQLLRVLLGLQLRLRRSLFDMAVRDGVLEIGRAGKPFP